LVKLYRTVYLPAIHIDCQFLVVEIIQYTVKPAYAVTSVKQSPVLKGHRFLVLS
jgi:hypothetical protein